jgi:hypothetical protein
MGLLNRHGSRSSARERGQMRRRLREIGEQREERLRDLGGLTLEMHKRDRFERRLLSEKAEEIAALDREAELLRRALDEGLTLGELEGPGDGASKLGAPAESQPQ